MKRGYVRQTPHWTLAAQLKMLEEAGVKTVYPEQKGKAELPERAVVIRSLRRGDQLVVSGLGRLALNRADLLDVLAEVEAHGAVVVDAQGRVATPQAAAMVTEAMSEWAGELRMPSRAEARRRGKLGGRPVKVPQMPMHEAVIFWRDLTLTGDEALDRMTGWTRKMAYRKLGKRIAVRGRRPKDIEK